MSTKTVSRMVARKGGGLRRRLPGMIVAGSPSKEAAVAQRRKKVDTTEYSGRVAVRLRTIRENKGLSREQLWKILDAAGVEKVSVPAIFSWENGNRKIDPDMYPKLAKALGVRLFEFLPEK